MVFSSGFLASEFRAGQILNLARPPLYKILSEIPFAGLLLSVSDHFHSPSQNFKI
ncbi:hypothetical protein CAMGR0001_0176 [Campylobacter gracilis RM3268]|uniref:Uncharacterized protein n=1 Tax=Campylobacter gracilis RM3268 TaxID=553220 RepID=C8PKF6_9BACT|nr:hypothetical protein CAMGR0001_0176 [Campylobacter gracilis RM3268]